MLYRVYSTFFSTTQFCTFNYPDIIVKIPFLCLLFATARLTVVFILTAQGLCITEVPVKAIRKNTHLLKSMNTVGKNWFCTSACVITVTSLSVYVYLRQCVIEVFCSTSTDKSKKSSSLLLTCKNRGHVSSLTY